MCEPYLDHDLKKPIVKTHFQDNEGILNINQVLDAIELLVFFRYNNSIINMALIKLLFLDIHIEAFTDEMI